MRNGLRVPLPDDLPPLRHNRNPIHALIRRTFSLNRKDTSPRLVISALKNGYRFLDLLRTAAESPSGPLYNDVLSTVREYTRATTERARNPILRKGQEPTLPPPPENWTPMLTLVQGATPTSPPVYKPTNRPLPKEQLTGERKVPVLDDTFGFPFLRISRPQSRRLGHQLYNLVKRRVKREELITQLKEEAVYDAEEEDVWEAMLEREFGVEDPARTTYVRSVKLSIWHLALALNEEKKHMVARGKAMWEIVEKERALLEEEKEYWEEWRKKRVVRAAGEEGERDKEETSALKAVKEKEAEDREEQRALSMLREAEEKEGGEDREPKLADGLEKTAPDEMGQDAMPKGTEDKTRSFYDGIVERLRPQISPAKPRMPALRRTVKPKRSAAISMRANTGSGESASVSTLESKLQALRVSENHKNR